MTEVFSFNIFIKKSCGEYFNLFAPLTASWQQFTHKHLWSCVLTAQELILIRLVFCILFRFILSLNIKLIAISEWIFPFKLITRLYMDFIKSFDLMQLMFLTKYDKLFSKLYTADFHKTLWHPKKKNPQSCLLHTNSFKLSSQLWHGHSSTQFLDLTYCK